MAQTPTNVICSRSWLSELLEGPYRKISVHLAEIFQLQPQFLAILQHDTWNNGKVALPFWAIKSIFNKTDKCRKVVRFRWWNLLNDMCRMGRWSFWSWFDVNRSTFDKDMCEKTIRLRSKWPWPLIFWSSVKGRPPNFPENINFLPRSNTEWPKAH